MGWAERKNPNSQLNRPRKRLEKVDLPSAKKLSLALMPMLLGMLMAKKREEEYKKSNVVKEGL